MVFKKWNIIYPSKKIFNELKTIEKVIKPFYNKIPNIFSHQYIPSFDRDTHTLNKIEESVNKLQKTKIIDEDCSFHEEYPAISSFLYEAYCFEEEAKDKDIKKFVNIALKLSNKLDFYKPMDIFSKVLIL